MHIYSTCHFKDPETDRRFIDQWVSSLEQLNAKRYKRIDVNTSLGNTVVWSILDKIGDKLPIFIFPGFRTSSLFWDLDDNLQMISDRYQIYLVETNGQPTLSDGHTPDIKSLDYGHWAAEVIKHFTLERVHIAGASFGGLICLKLAIVAPELVDKVFLLNPGCLQPFSMTLKNLFYNLLPIISPSLKNITLFLKKAIFNPPLHDLPEERMQLLIDYELFALTRHVDKAQKPYTMRKGELAAVKSPVFLILGEKDLLFPYLRSVHAAKIMLANLKEVIVIPDTGHGIETCRKAIVAINNILNEVQRS
jgi:pimeloyl-ACP methyl ester carboxylesterase